MKSSLTRSRTGLSVLVLSALLISFSASAAAPDSTIASKTATVDGVTFHYLTAGHGPALLLLHGYAETSLMWRPIIPQLAARFTVIAPDLPGIGDSSIPADGLDMKLFCQALGTGRPPTTARPSGISASTGPRPKRW